MQQSREVTTTFINLLNIPVWGAILTYYYMLFLLRARKMPVVWFGGPGSLRNYTRFLALIRAESKPSRRLWLKCIFIAHWAGVAMMFAAFFWMVASHRR